jgi:polysaccharide biosynthesis transport protein
MNDRRGLTPSYALLRMVAGSSIHKTSLKQGGRTTLMDYSETEPTQGSGIPQVPARQRPHNQPTADIQESITVERIDSEDSINLLDYWRVIVKRRWIILVVILGVTALTAIGTWGATPIYQATIKIQIDPEQMNVLPFKETMDPGSNYAQSQEYLQTHFKVLASNTLADRVIRALQLESNAVFLSGIDEAKKSGFLGWIRSLLSSREDKSARPLKKQYSRYTKAFIDGLTVTPIRNSRLVEVSFNSRNPNLSATVVNTLADQYIELNFQTKFDATQKASSFLERQSTDLKARLEKSEEGLVRFSQEHNIYALGEKEDVILQKLGDLNTALTAVQAERIQKESLWKIMQAAGPEVFPDALRSLLVKDLETNAANLRVAQAKLSASFKPGWPELDQVTDQLAEAEKLLATERQKAIRNVEIEYRTAVTREQLLTHALEAQKKVASELNQNSIQYNILKRQVDGDKQLFDGLLQRMKEAEVSAGLKSSNIHVVDVAEPPGKPYRPNKPLNLALALATGLILGVGLAFFTEHLDSSLKTPDEIDRYLALPSLGVIPSHESLLSASRRKHLSAASIKQNGDPDSVELVTHHDTRSLLSEAYRNLRTSILLSSSNGHPPKLLVITSSQKGEGKTTTSINISVALAQAGGSVVLLDCDMRDPKIHRALKLSPESGMSTYLSGQSELLRLVQKTEVPNLSVVTSGHIPPNPAELIGSQRMKDGLALLARSFSHVVIDTPPVLSVTDARVLGTMVDGVILVIKGGVTPREAVRLTKRLLHEVHVRIIGTLLNDVNIRSADYAYYSRYYYHGYGRYGQREKESVNQKEA